MRLSAALLCVLLPATTHAEPPVTAYAGPPAQHSHRARWRDPEVALGVALLGAGYAGALASGVERDGHGALFVPVVGPWFQLATLPDCGTGDMTCEHGGATRGVLVLSGIAQLVGTGFLVHGLVAHRDERFLLGPSMTSGKPGLAISGRF